MPLVYTFSDKSSAWLGAENVNQVGCRCTPALCWLVYTGSPGPARLERRPQAYNSNSRSAERPAVFTILYKMIALNYSFVQFAEQGCQNDHPLFCAKQPFCVMSHSTSRQMLF